MLVFTDTEFTDFIHIDLISIALVTEDGREFYAERTDYRSDDCSTFVLGEVLPLLGRVPGATCSRAELARRLHAWFDALPEPATLLFDYFSDWELLADAVNSDEFDKRPANVGEKLKLTAEIIDNPAYLRALNSTFTREFPPHHALADARAMMAGYKAWQGANKEPPI